MVDNIIKFLIALFLLGAISWVGLSVYKLHYWQPDIKSQVDYIQKDISQQGNDQKNSQYTIEVKLSKQDNDLVKYDLSTLQVMLSLIAILLGIVSYMGYNGLQEAAKAKATEVATDEAKKAATDVANKVATDISLDLITKSLYKDDPFEEYVKDQGELKK